MEDSEDKKTFQWRVELRDNGLYASVISDSGKVIERNPEFALRKLEDWARFPDQECAEHDKELAELWGKIAYYGGSPNPQVKPAGLLGSLSSRKDLVEWNWPSYALQGFRNIKQKNNS